MDESLLATRDYQNYLDIYSFADYWLVEDLVGNFDSARPKSTYFYKDRNSKLKAGPLWDFDVYTYNGNTGFVMKDSLYYRALFKDPQFVNIVKEKWNGNDQYEGLKNLASPSVINEYIDIQYQYLRRAALRDRAIWPTEGTGANSDKKIPYDSAVELMKSNYQKRYNWFDGAVNSLVVNYDAKPVSNENVDAQEDKSEEFGFGF